MTSPNPPIRLLVVDDQPIVRRGLAMILEAEPGIELVGTAGDGAQALELATRLHPDIVLMDLQMPRLSGIAATRQLLERDPLVRVVVLTTFDDDERVFEAIRAGAHAYLLKDAGEDEILETIRAVRRGESKLSPRVASKVLAQFRMMTAHGPAGAPDAPKPAVPPGYGAAADEALSDKEARVLALISEGLSNRQIAERMFLAEGTIKNYVSRIMEKLHARTRVELALKAAHGRDPS